MVRFLRKSQRQGRSQQFSADFAWQQQYAETIQQIVGKHILEPSRWEADAKEATDFMILKARDLRIACRMRGPEYADAFPWDFTIRSSRISRHKSELEKIIEGQAI